MDRVLCCMFFFFNDTATTEIYTLSLHDALPIFQLAVVVVARRAGHGAVARADHGRCPVELIGIDQAVEVGRPAQALAESGRAQHRTPLPLLSPLPASSFKTKTLQ